MCALDRERFPTVLTLMTSMNTIAAMHPSWGGSDSIKQVIALERATARAAIRWHLWRSRTIRKENATHLWPNAIRGCDKDPASTKVLSAARRARSGRPRSESPIA